MHLLSGVSPIKLLAPANPALFAADGEAGPIANHRNATRAMETEGEDKEVLEVVEMVRGVPQARHKNSMSPFGASMLQRPRTFSREVGLLVYDGE